jgi:hypothetical protein
VAFRPLEGPAPESRLVVGWKEPPVPPPALAAFLAVAAPAETAALFRRSDGKSAFHPRSMAARCHHL